VREVVIAEARERRTDRCDRRRAQRADRGSGSNAAADVLEECEVFEAAVSVHDAVQDLVEPGCAFAAGRALPARLGGEEAHEPGGNPDRTHRVVEHHESRRERRARSRDVVDVEAQVEVLGAEPRKRRAGEERGELAIADDTAAEVGTEDQIAERRVVELDLVVSRTTDATRDAEKIRMPVDRAPPSAPNASPPLRTIHGTADSVSTLFTIVGRP
jgi:hypothetical protein